MIQEQFWFGCSRLTLSQWFKVWRNGLFRLQCLWGWFALTFLHVSLVLSVANSQGRAHMTWHAITGYQIVIIMTFIALSLCITWIKKLGSVSLNLHAKIMPQMLHKCIRNRTSKILHKNSNYAWASKCISKSDNSHTHCTPDICFFYLVCNFLLILCV